MRSTRSWLMLLAHLGWCSNVLAAENEERLQAVDEVEAPLIAEAKQPSEVPEQTKTYKGFIDFNGYYDTRKALTFTLNTLLNFPHGIQYFSLVNYFNAPSSSRLQDLEYYVSEQNLRYGPFRAIPLDLAGQWLSISGPDNDLLRFGIRAKVFAIPGVKSFLKKIHLSYFFTAFAVQTNLAQVDGYPFQLEHVYRWNIFPNHLDDRIYLAGFLDHNLVAAPGADVPASRILTEHQLGLRIWRGLHAVTELRFNQYLPDERLGLGLGLEYFVPLEVTN